MDDGGLKQQQFSYTDETIKSVFIG